MGKFNGFYAGVRQYALGIFRDAGLIVQEILNLLYIEAVLDTFHNPFRKIEDNLGICMHDALKNCHLGKGHSAAHQHPVSRIHHGAFKQQGESKILKKPEIDHVFKGIPVNHLVGHVHGMDILLFHETKYIGNTHFFGVIRQVHRAVYVVGNPPEYHGFPVHLENPAV